MSMENGNAKKRNGTPKRQGPEALKDFAEIANRIGKSPDAKDTVSMSANDPKYAEIRERFEKHDIPLNLMDYALGLKALPARDAKGQFPSAETGRISALLDEHGSVVMNEMRLAYQAHLRKLEKDPAYAQEWNEAGQKWVESGKEGSFVIVPATAQEARTTKDLSPMPPEILDRVKKHPAVVNYTLAMFLRQMRDWPYEDEQHRAFARYFADKVEEKAFRENLKDRERSMYENAYWALLDLNVAEEVSDTTKRGRSYPEIRVHGDEVTRHIRDFIESERLRRNELPKLMGEELKKAQADLAARPSNIIRAIGDRLFVPTRGLPIETDAIEAKITKEEEKQGENSESMRLPGDLRFLSRMAGRLFSTASQESAKAERDVDALRAYLADIGSWSPNAQTGFDIINKELSGNLQSIEKIRETVRSAMGNEEMEDKYKDVFDTHATNAGTVEKKLLATQAELISLWNTHNGNISDALTRDRISTLEAQNAEYAEEAADHLTALATLRDKLHVVQKQLEAKNVVTGLPSALEALDAYIDLTSE
jgi:hypothetical protein